MSRLALYVALLQCSTLFAACAGSSMNVCTQDTECASGFCKADGTCGEPSTSDGGVDAADDVDAPPSGTCAPDHDGNVTQAELPLVAGRTANFKIATDASFDTAGTANGNGSRRWDLSTALANDTDRPTTLLAPAGTWWAASFPTAAYAVPLAADSDLLGVFAVDATSLALLGVVSPDGGTYRTELAYDPPAKVLALPVAAGATWTSSSTVSGYALGAFTAYTERYESRVDQVGTMTTPYGEFPVVRVATDLTRTQGAALLLTKRSFSWIAECFGAVATVSSQDFESSAEFSDPAEVRRLAP